MLAIWVSAAIICAASLIAGRAFLVLLGRPEWTWLSAPVGFGLLVIVAQPLIRLPGRAATAAIVIGLALVACLLYLRGRWSGEQTLGEVVREGLPVAVILLLVTAIPFLASGRVGVLGTGIYTNDQAAQLYWADWLQNGIGHEPRGVRFGYPLGPQSLAAIVAEATGMSLVSSFNGLLVAIPVLTGLAALAVLRELDAARRVLAAVLVAVPFLAVSYLAQSAFKETAMALFVVGLAAGLRELDPEIGRLRAAAIRATIGGLVVLAGASVFTYSVPGIAWFAAGAAIWLVAELVAGRLEISGERARAALRPALPIIVVALVAVAVLIAAEAGSISSFAHRLGEVRESTGRLLSPVSPREALAIWPKGDFRLNAAGTSGAVLGTLVALLAAALAGWWWLRRRDFGVAAALAGAVVLYALARWKGGINVEAKTLAILSPVFVLFVAGALLSRDGVWRGGMRIAAPLVALVFLVGAAWSSFKALRAAPVGTTRVADQLNDLRSGVQGRPVVFLAADRFSPYWLRGTRVVASPGGYVPSKGLQARPQKKWEQGRPVDFDTLPSKTLDSYRFAITTNAAFQSASPENWRPTRSTTDFTLWKRDGGATPRKVLDEKGDPGATLDCSDPRQREISSGGGTAGLLADPVVGRKQQWKPEGSFAGTDGSASLKLDVPAGNWYVSMQYHSPVPMVLTAPGLHADLPASLDGMYAFAPGEGPVWPVGGLAVDKSGPVTFTVRQQRLTGIQRLLGVERPSWLGLLALTPVPRTEDVGLTNGETLHTGPQLGNHETPLADACSQYVDWYTQR
jgi:hypothetical protein